MIASALREACDRNYTAAFAALVPHIAAPVGGVRQFGSLVAVVTGLPNPFFNPVMVTDPGASSGDLSAALRWTSSQGVLASVQLREDLRERFEPIARGFGLEPDPWIAPGMALHPIPAIAPPEPSLRTQLVDPTRFDDWHSGIAYGPRFRDVYGPTLLDDPAFRLVVGYVDDEPVAGAAAIISDTVVGIYAVGTAEHARRRGYGRALTWAAVQAGVEAGCHVAVLQSTEMAAGLYRSMGFVEVCRYLEFLPPA